MALLGEKQLANYEEQEGLSAQRNIRLDCD
jgi:hypothetical protein